MKFNSYHRFNELIIDNVFVFIFVTEEIFHVKLYIDIVTI